MTFVTAACVEVMDLVWDPARFGVGIDL
jgi:hypothetical protein